MITRGMRDGAMLAAVLVFLAGLGCGSSRKKPQTYPVRGTVTFVNGKTGPEGAIQFESLDHPEHNATGEIQPDGTFQLFTFFEGQKLPGALEGSYRVLVVPRMRDNKIVPIHQLPTEIRIEAKENEIAIQLPVDHR